MKLIAILIVAFCINASASVSAQNITISAKNEPLISVFKKIEKQSGYLFFYPAKLIEGSDPVTIELKNVPIQVALQKLLQKQRLTFDIADKTIVINSRRPAFPRADVTAIDRINVRGKVVGDNGQPLAGATIKVKGTTISLNTGTDGEFYIAGVDGKALLEISYVGFKTKTITVKEDLGNVPMEVGSSDLDQVSIVSTGYENIPKERATGSFSKVDNSTYNRQVSTDVLSRLKGIAPSLSFDERSPNGTYLSVRGRSTIYGNDQPLIVVDNFPFEGNINNINPNDIEDISILKDAAAASIWGVRAGNGVIVIRTKKGRYDQRLKIDFNSNVNIGEKPDLYYQKKLNSSDFIDMETMLFDNKYFDDIIDNTTTAPPISPVVEILNQHRNNVITADQAKSQIDALREVDLRKDLEKYFYQKSIKQQYALNISEGNENQNYYLSAGLDKNKASALGNNFNRFVINGNHTVRLLKKLEISTGIFYNQNNTQGNSSLSAITLGDGRSMYPYAKLADDSGNALFLTKDFRNSFKSSLTSEGFLNWDYYPLDELTIEDNKNQLNSTRITSGINYKIINGLSADMKFQYEHQSSEGRIFKSQDSYFMRNLINQFTTGSGETLKRNIPLGGSLENSFSFLNSINGRGQLNYDRSWSEHQLTAIMGFEAREVRTNGSRNGLYGYDPTLGTSVGVNYQDTFPIFPFGYPASIPRNDGIGETIDRYRSYYVNASYTFRERYTASASGRVDQSNLFGVSTNQKAVPLWSGGLKWNLGKENFYNIAWLPEVSLRTSFGYNGNLDNTLTAFTTATLSNSSIYQQPAAYLINAPNSNLRWERNAVWNLGLDFATKGNRISGSIEYFTKNGKDLIGSGSLDPTTGFNMYRGNVANMKGEGMDIELRTINILSKNFNWTTNYLFSHATDKVTAYEPIPTVTDFLTDNSLDRVSAAYSPVAGRPLFGIYSYPWAGLDPTTGAARGYLNGVPSTDYSAISAEIALDPVNKLVYDGPAIPPYFGALRNAFAYRNFEVSFNVTYRFGYYFRRQSINYGDAFSRYNTHSDYNERWQKTGDELHTNVPALAYPADPTADGYYNNSAVLIEKGDHIRLQDVSLSYTLHGFGGKQEVFKQIKFYTYASNLGLLWTANKKGIDPDFPFSKPIRSLAIGLNCSF